MTLINLYRKIKKLFDNSRFVTFLILCLATAFSIFYQGYYFGRVDQGFFLAFLKKLANPQLYPNDFLMELLLDLFPGYLWKILSIFYPFVDLEVFMLVLHIVFRFSFFLGIYLLTYFITKKREIAYLNVFFWLTSKPSLGYDIFYNNFVQSQAAFPILLFSSYFYFKDRYLWAFILLTIAFYIHQPLSAPFLLIFILIMLMTRKLRLFFQYSLLFFIGAFPLYANIFTIIQKVGSYDLQWLEIMSIRNGYHLFPFSWGIQQWLPFFIYLVFIGVYYRFFAKNVEKRTRKKLTLFILVPTLVIIASTFFSEIAPTPRILAFTPFHTSTVFTIFSSIVISLCIYFFIQSKNLLIRGSALTLSFIYFFNQYNLQFPNVFVIFVPLYILVFLFFGNNLKFIFTLSLVISVLWLPYMFVRNQLRVDTYYDAWVETQKWANKNTSTDSLFVVPIYLDSFRLYSERPIVVDWKDGGVGFFSPNYLMEWWKRLEDIGLTKEKYSDDYQRKTYNSISTEKARRLLKKYKANFIVLEKNNRIDLDSVYSNNHFVVYK